MTKDNLRSYMIITFGTFLISFETYFFCFPNGFAYGGGSGIPVLVNAALPSVSPTTISFIFNTLCLILGFIFFRRGFAIRTVYSSIIMNLFMFLFEYIYPLSSPLTDMRLLELLYTVLLVGLGTALLFNEDASSGGMDVIALILKKYTRIKPGRAIFLCCVMIVIGSSFIFGLEIGLCSMFGLLAKTIVIDRILESMNTVKCLHIITDDAELLKHHITETMGKGATVVDCMGAYTDSTKKLIITVMNQKEAKRLKKYIEDNSPKTFFVVYKSGEVHSSSLNIDV